MNLVLKIAVIFAKLSTNKQFFMERSLSNST